MCCGITTGTETEPDGTPSAAPAQDGKAEIPAKKASANGSRGRRGGVYSTPDYGTPYATEIYGFRCATYAIGEDHG